MRSATSLRERGPAYEQRICVRVWGIIIINTQSSKDCHYQVESAKEEEEEEEEEEDGKSVYRQTEIYTCTVAGLLLERNERAKETCFLYFRL